MLLLYGPSCTSFFKSRAKADFSCKDTKNIPNLEIFFVYSIKI